jgi:hypothetical protein
VAGPEGWGPAGRERPLGAAERKCGEQASRKKDAQPQRTTFRRKETRMLAHTNNQYLPDPKCTNVHLLSLLNDVGATPHHPLYPVLPRGNNAFTLLSILTPIFYALLRKHICRHILFSPLLLQTKMFTTDFSN